MARTYAGCVLHRTTRPPAERLWSAGMVAQRVILSRHDHWLGLPSLRHDALGTRHRVSGPSRVEARGEFPTNKIWNVHGAYDVDLTYPGNIKVQCLRQTSQRTEIFRRRWLDLGNTLRSDDIERSRSAGADVPPLAASDPRLLSEEGLSVHLPRSDEHHKNWLECVRSRQQPIAPAAIAHRSSSACIVSWIAMKLGRPLTWDVKTEHFVNDAQANAMLSRAERAPYGAVRLSKKHRRKTA